MAASISYYSDDATTLESNERSDSDSGGGYSHPAPSKTRHELVLQRYYQIVEVVIVILHVKDKT